MRGRLVMVGWVAITACRSPATPGELVDAATIDAAVDAPCGAGRTSSPITASGFTPAGSLDFYQDAEAFYACNWYSVILAHTIAGEACSSDRWMLIDFNFPTSATQPGSGSFPARASEFQWTISSDPLDATAEISFEATLVDPPVTDGAHLVGRFVANAPDWSINLAIDLRAAPGIGSCTLSTGSVN